jgi:hypothetical protein
MLPVDFTFAAFAAWYMVVFLSLQAESMPTGKNFP